MESDELESMQVVECVHKYREYWKPRKIKVVLLAESHAYTSESNFKYKISKKYYENLALAQYPENYVRFVYCIGYGENQILDNKKTNNDLKNPGTPQYWKLFFSCIHTIEKIMISHQF